MMARFRGEVGFGATAEIPANSGIHKLVITERTYIGDVNRKSTRLVDGEGLNDDITVEHEISIVADSYAIDHAHEIKYVLWGGAAWKVTSVTIQRPRLILNLGSVYNGATI